MYDGTCALTGITWNPLYDHLQEERLSTSSAVNFWVLGSDQINCRKQLDMDQQDSSRMPIYHNGDVPPRWQGHTKNIQEQHLFLAFCPLFHELEAPAWAIDQVFRFENTSKMPVVFIFQQTSQLVLVQSWQIIRRRLAPDASYHGPGSRSRGNSHFSWWRNQRWTL